MAAVPEIFRKIINNSAAINNSAVIRNSAFVEIFGGVLSAGFGGKARVMWPIEPIYYSK